MQCTSSHKTSPMRATAFASNFSWYVEPWFTCRSSSCFEADGCARRRREKLWRSHGLMPHSIFSTRFASNDQTRDGISTDILAIEAGTRSASSSPRSWLSLCTNGSHAASSHDPQPGRSDGDRNVRQKVAQNTASKTLVDEKSNSAIEFRFSRAQYFAGVTPWFQHIADVPEEICEITVKVDLLSTCCRQQFLVRHKNTGFHNALDSVFCTQTATISIKTQNQRMPADGTSVRSVVASCRRFTVGKPSPTVLTQTPKLSTLLTKRVESFS